MILSGAALLISAISFVVLVRSVTGITEHANSASRRLDEDEGAVLRPDQKPLVVFLESNQASLLLPPRTDHAGVGRDSRTAYAFCVLTAESLPGLLPKWEAQCN